MPKPDRGAAKAPSRKSPPWGGRRHLPTQADVPSAALPTPAPPRIHLPALALAWIMPRRS